MLIKKILFFTCFFCASFASLSQSSEEEAIKALIQAETDDFTKIPYADMIRKYWILDENTFMCVSDANGDVRIRYKDQLLQDEGVAPQEKTTVEKTNYSIIINGNMASAYHHQVVTLVEHGTKQYSHEVRVLEKVSGAWKIHCSSVQVYAPK